jgi:hypothetical protein
MDVRRASIYMKTLNNPIEHLTVQCLLTLTTRLPEKCRLEMERALAAMKEPDSESLIKIISIHANMEAPKTAVPEVKRKANVVQQQRGGRNNKKYEQGKNDQTRFKMCTICLSPKHTDKNHTGKTYACNKDGCNMVHHPGLHDALANHSSAMAVIHQKKLVISERDFTTKNS